MYQNVYVRFVGKLLKARGKMPIVFVREIVIISIIISRIKYENVQLAEKILKLNPQKINIVVGIVIIKIVIHQEKISTGIGREELVLSMIDVILQNIKNGDRKFILEIILDV